MDKRYLAGKLLELTGVTYGQDDPMFAVAYVAEACLKESITNATQSFADELAPIKDATTKAVSDIQAAVTTLEQTHADQVQLTGDMTTLMEVAKTRFESWQTTSVEAMNQLFQNQQKALAEQHELLVNVIAEQRKGLEAATAEHLRARQKAEEALEKFQNSRRDVKTSWMSKFMGAGTN